MYLTPEESFLAGKLLEHTWALIFGEAAVLMPLHECELTDCDLHGGQHRVYHLSTKMTP